MGRLLHYSSEAKVVPYDVDPGEPTAPGKPRGLWLSVEGPDDWRSWCEAENFGDIGKQFAHEVTLAKKAKILRLTNAEEIDKFTAEYPDPTHAHKSYGTFFMDWRRVGKKFDGIIIAPYCWERRFTDTSRWYYGWDCASGCIWNAKAIAKIERSCP